MWILIVWVSANIHGTVAMQEFSTRERCVAAGDAIKPLALDWTKVAYVCVQK